MALTGCRIGEAFSLKRLDVLQNPSCVKFRDTKNYSDRSVFIGEELFEMISQIPDESEYIFYSYRTKKPLNTQEVNKDLKKRALQVGIRVRVYNHLFRHSFVTLMVNSNVDWFILSTIIGHKNPKTTLKYYERSLTRQKQCFNKHPYYKGIISWEESKKIAVEAIEEAFDTSMRGIEIIDTEDSKIHIIIYKNRDSTLRN